MGLNKVGSLSRPEICGQHLVTYAISVATAGGHQGQRPEASSPRLRWQGRGVVHAQAMICDRVVEVRMHVLECDLDDSVVRHSHAFRGSRLY